TATSRLIIHRKVHDTFVARLAEAAEKLVLGDGRQSRTQVGPLIHAGSLEKVERYVAIGKEEGAELVCGGERPKGARVANGWFFKPTVFTNVKAGSRLATEEIFGPVLAVMQVHSYEQAVRVNNEVRYGLSSSLYTRN